MKRTGKQRARKNDRKQHMVGLCRFCEKRRQLTRSHIISRFVFADRKRRYQTPVLIHRTRGEEDRRVQDGIQQYLLCNECDNRRLGRFERLFAAHLFHRLPLKRDEVINYGPWLAKFCAVTTWRVLTHIRDKGGPDNYPEALLELAERALTVWKAYLRDEIPTAEPFGFHILPLNEGPTHEEWITAGSVVYRAFYDSQTGAAYVIAKLGSIVIFGTVVEPQPSNWRNTRVKYDEVDLLEMATSCTFQNA